MQHHIHTRSFLWRHSAEKSPLVKWYLSTSLGMADSSQNFTQMYSPEWIRKDLTSFYPVQQFFRMNLRVRQTANINLNDALKLFSNYPWDSKYSILLFFRMHVWQVIWYGGNSLGDCPLWMLQLIIFFGYLENAIVFEWT